MHTDASEVGLGGVLSQVRAGEEHPITYISRKLLPNERNYSTVEKEALAIKWSLDKLRYYLLGREFTLARPRTPKMDGRRQGHQRPSDAVVPGSPGLQVYGGPPTGQGARQRRRPIQMGYLLGRVPGLPEA